MDNNIINKVIKFLNKYHVSFIQNSFYIRTNRTQIRIPSINEDVAYLAGVICGDGCLHTPSKNNKNAYRFRITITIKSYKYFEFIRNLILKLFNYKPTFITHRGHFDLYINSAAIFAYFYVMEIPFGKKYGKLNIPLKIKKNKSLFLSFLAGLIDTDGSLDGNYIYISQKDVLFLKNIKKISEMNGLEVKFNLSPFKLSDGSIYQRYYIRIKNFPKFLLKHKRFLIPKTLKALHKENNYGPVDQWKIATLL